MRRSVLLLLAPLLLSVSPVSAQDTVPVVGVWNMDAAEDKGFVKDAGAFNVNGKLVAGATLVAGRHGNAVELDGKQARVVFAGSSAIDRLTRAISFTAWIKPAGLPDGDTCFIVTKRPGWWAGKPYSFEINRNGHLGVSYNDGKWRRLWKRGKLIKPGDWQHVAFTFKARDELVIYHDGKAVARQKTGKALFPGGDPLVLGWEKGGNFAGGNYKGFHGLIDSVRVYPVALSAAQVKQDMHGTLKTRPAKHEDLPKRGMPPAAIPDAVKAAPEPDDPLECYIIFDKEPRAKGMWFEKRKCKPTVVDLDGRKTEAWVAQYGSAPGLGWGRSFYFTITDPRFKKGRMPAVDIEVTYRLPAWSGTQLWADTAAGSKQVLSGWQSKHWKTIRTRIDNAHFGERDFGHSNKAARSDGYDLRFNGFTSDLWIRSIRIKGYDLDDDVDYRRLLKLTSIDSERGVYFFHPDDRVTLQYKLWNISRKAVDTTFNFTVFNRAGKMLSQRDGARTINGEEKLSLPFTFSTAGLEHGQYFVKFRLNTTRDDKPYNIIDKRIAFGIGSRTRLRKAKAGEFLYGLDVMLGSPYRKDLLLQWAGIMGVDILRGGARLHEWDDALPVYREHDLKLMPMVDVPYHKDRKRLAAETEKRARAAAAVAARYPELRYWELGNEPDLPFFYKGPIDDYSRGMSVISQAIKQANPNTVIMNGGLCFHGKDGNRRARRFVEIVNPKHLDAWAYHGHGPGVQAERNAYRRMKDCAARHGKGDKPCIETESGFAAGNAFQEDIQAHTAIQKIVFAQSQGLPTFFWFRLWFENANSYGNLYSHKEPRPVVLAYRNLVETLRGYAFERTIDLQKTGAEGYVFKETAGAGKVCVLWVNHPALYNVYLDLAAEADDVKDLRLIDKYGNAEAGAVLPDGSTPVAVGYAPIFVKWQGIDADYRVATAPPVLTLGAAGNLLINRRNTVQVQVRNPFDRELSTRLNLQAQSEVPVTVTPAASDLTLRPKEKRELEFTVDVGRPQRLLNWPRAWTVFTYVDEAAADPATYSAIPKTLACDGKQTAGKVAFARNNKLDFEAVNGNFRTRAAALAFAVVESDRERTVNVGASADWWMAWYVNGEKVYDTLAKGNGGGYSIRDHVFPIKLKKGSNLLAVKVLSGSQGWKLFVGGPGALRRLENGMETIRVTMTETDKVITSEAVGIKYSFPLPQLDRAFWDIPAAAWDKREPTVIIGSRGIINFFDKFPDAAKWWHGEDDLAAEAWLHADTDFLYLVVKVRDDVDRTGNEAGAMWQNDSLQVAFSRTGKKDFNEYAIGRVNGKLTVYKHVSNYGADAGVIAANGEIKADITRRDKTKATLYRVAIRRDVIDREQFFVNFIVNDDDFGARKQYLEWMPGIAKSKEPALWYRAVMP